MRKKLLICSLLLAAATAGAQGTYENPTTLVSGTNAAELGSDDDGNPVTGTAVWQYTAEEGTSLTLSPSSTTTLQVRYIRSEGDTVNMNGAYVSYPTYCYPIAKDMSVYVAAHGSETISFSATMANAPTAGQGTSASSPLTITAGEDFFVGNGLTQSGTQCVTYATFTPDEAGVLVFTATGSVSVSVNGGSAEYFSYGNGAYTYSLSAAAGETYSLTFTAYTTARISTEMTHPTEGSLEMPFQIKEGENTVPAAYGDYWYTYTNSSVTGYASIASNASLPGGQVLVYNSTYSINYNQTYASSNTGSYDVRFEMPSAGTTYYIHVSKAETSAGDDTFTFSAEPYQPGEQESNPIALDKLPATVTTANAGGTTYYSFTMTDTESLFLNVAATSEIANSATTIAIYRQGNSYSILSQGNTSARAEVAASTYGPQTYIIRVQSYETQPITLSVGLEEIAQGDIITNPLEAVSGTNTVSGSGTKYYAYTATLSGRLTVSAAPEMTVTFPRGTGQYDGNYTASHSGVDYTIDAVAGTRYLIALAGCQDGDEFIVSEREYQMGESRENPIIVDGDTYTLGSETASNLWLQWTAPQDGLLEVYFDLTYVYTCYVYFGRTTDTYLSAMITSNGSTQTYSTRQIVSAGETFLVNLQLDAAYAGYSVTFSMRDLEQGESVNNPLTLTLGEETTLETGTRQIPIWYKVALGEGELKMTSSIYLTAQWYTSYENAQAGNGSYIMWNYDYAPDYSSYTCHTTYTITQPGVYYLRVEGGDGSNTLLLEGEAAPQGIEIDNPLTAVLGDNATQTGTRYYTYTATQTGMMEVTAAEGMAISFPASAETPNQSLAANVEGQTYTLSITEGNTYYIKVTSEAADAVFTIVERDFLPGEDITTAIELDVNGTATLPEASEEWPVWYTFAIDMPGELTITTDNAAAATLYGEADSYGEMAFDENNASTVRVEAGTYTLCVTFSEGENSITLNYLSDTALGIVASKATAETTAITAGNGVIAVNANGAEVSVYSLTGARMASARVEGNATFHVGSGTYIVKVGDMVRKVAVK